MLVLDRGNAVVKIDGRLLYHFHVADDVILLTSIIGRVKSYDE